MYETNAAHDSNYGKHDYQRRDECDGNALTFNINVRLVIIMATLACAVVVRMADDVERNRERTAQDDHDVDYAREGHRYLHSTTIVINGCGSGTSADDGWDDQLWWPAAIICGNQT